MKRQGGADAGAGEEGEGEEEGLFKAKAMNEVDAERELATNQAATSMQQIIIFPTVQRLMNWVPTRERLLN